MTIMDGSYSARAEDRSAAQQGRRKYEFDLFVATPMSAFGQDAGYGTNREALIQFVRRLQAFSRFRRLFCPALKITKFSDFDGSELALKSDLAALEVSEAFVLFYLSPLPPKPSSVLVEAGAALTRRIPSLYLVRQKSDLPYMLASADKLDAGADARARPFVNIIEVGDNSVVEVDPVIDWLDIATKSLSKFRI